MDNPSSTATGLDRPAAAGPRATRQMFTWIAVLVLASGMVYYYEGVLIPLRQKEFRVGAGARGNWADLYVQWLGSCEVLQHRRNPYSSEVTREIQRGFYGETIESGGAKFNNPEAFAYPVYVTFLFAPFLHVSFSFVQVVFTVIFFLLTLASIPLWMRALNIRLRRWVVIPVLLIAMSSYPVVDGLHLQQMTLLTAGLLAASLAAVASGQLFWAGVALAIASIKPQLVLLVIVFLLMWTVSNWASRKWFAIGLASSTAALFAASELLLPGWFHSWWEAVQAYRGYIKPSLLRSLLGQRLAMVVGGIAVLFCCALFWRVRKEIAGSDRFNFAAVAALTATVLLLPDAGGGKYNQVILIPAAIWVSIWGRKAARMNAIAHSIWLLTVVVLAGEWVLALPVSLIGLVHHRIFQREGTFFVAGPELLMYFFPLILALFVLSVVPQMLGSHSAAGE